MLLPPDINRSGSDFTVEKMPDGTLAVRFALAALKGVGEKAMAQVVAARDAAGPFTSFGDLASRIDPRQINKRQLESLAGGGAFDCLGVERSVAAAMVDTILSHASHAAESRGSAQVSLFGDADGHNIIDILPPKVAAWPADKKLSAEKEAIGFYFSSHPLDSYLQLLDSNRVIRAEQAMALSAPFEGRLAVTLAGLPEELFSRPGKDGRKFTMLVLSDQSGTFRLGCFEEDIAQAARHAVMAKEPVLVQADLVWRPGEDTPRMNARSIVPLTQVADNTPVELIVSLHNGESLQDIKTVLVQRQGGRGTVCVRVLLNGKINADACLVLPGKYKLDAGVRSALAGMRNVADVKLVS
jgi:DNA polymerase III subunit alpha